MNFVEPRVLFPQSEDPNPRDYSEGQPNIIRKQPPNWNNPQNPSPEDCFVGDTSVSGMSPWLRGRGPYEDYTHKQSIHNDTRPTRQVYKRDKEYPLSDNEERHDMEKRANTPQPASPNMHSYRNPLTKTCIPKFEHTSDTDSVSDVDDYQPKMVKKSPASSILNESSNVGEVLSHVVQQQAKMQNAEEPGGYAIISE